MSEIQSILFTKGNKDSENHWTQKKAEKWLEEHKYKHTKVDSTKGHLRYRQFDPISGFIYRIKSIGKGVKFVLAFPATKTKLGVRRL